MKICLIFFGNKKQCHWRELFFINTQFFVCLFYFEKILYLCSNKKTTMTELKFKNSIDDVQMSVLLYLLKSWNVEAEFSQQQPAVSTKKHKPISIQTLPFSTGMWADYDIDDKTLRTKAWGTEKRVAV
jgi:hypothetical protein